MLVSAVQWSESAICIHISALSQTSLSHLHTTPLSHQSWQSSDSHRAELPVLCNKFQPPIYFIHGTVYKSMPLSQFVLLSPPHAVSTMIMFFKPGLPEGAILFLLLEAMQTLMWDPTLRVRRNILEVIVPTLLVERLQTSPSTLLSLSLTHG